MFSSLDINVVMSLRQATMLQFSTRKDWRDGGGRAVPTDRLRVDWIAMKTATRRMGFG
jgi:hypothetical protein